MNINFIERNKLIFGADLQHRGAADFAYTCHEGEQENRPAANR